MIVADTQAIIWDTLTPNLLSEKAKRVLDVAHKEEGIYLCEISFWEIAMLIKKGRFDPKTTYKHFIDLILQFRNYIIVGINPDIADLAVNLPHEVNQDPADRIISATSLHYRCPLVTADKNLREASCLKTIW